MRNYFARVEVVHHIILGKKEFAVNFVLHCNGVMKSSQYTCFCLTCLNPV